MKFFKKNDQRPVPKRRKPSRVAESVRAFVSALAPGDYVPPPVVLAKVLGFKLPQVNQALQRLTLEGVLSRRYVRTDNWHCCGTALPTHYKRRKA